MTAAPYQGGGYYAPLFFSLFSGVMESSAQNPTRCTYQLTLKAQPSPVDEDRRLARLLKTALRTYGFRCLRVVREEKRTAGD